MHLNKFYSLAVRLILFPIFIAGESGKSTIVKQALMNYGSGFDNNTRASYHQIIIRNLYKGAMAIFEACADPDMGLIIKDAEVLEAGKRLTLLANMTLSHTGKRFNLDDRTVQDLRLLWNDENIQGALQNRHKFQLDDTWAGFVKKLEGYPSSWGGPTWEPNDSDIIEARNMTVGFATIDVTIDGKNFRFIDVGGQRAERRKWMNLFTNVDAVLFVAALSEYNQKLFEDRRVNRLTESLEMFKQYSSQNEFRDSAFMLFLNKYDLFQEKYYDQGLPLEKPFESDGIAIPPTKDKETDRDCMVALNWFADLYLQFCGRPSSEVFIHTTTALDEGNVKFVLESCRNYIFTRLLQAAGMMANMRHLEFARA